MSLPAFDVVKPRSLPGALEVLGHYGADAQLIAGGTDLIPSMKQGLFSPRVLLDLKGLRDLDFIRFDPDHGLEIGALTTISELANSALLAAQFPVLHEAAKTVASPLLRNMGTLGGNLCLDTRCLYYNQSSFWRGALGGCIKKDGAVCHVAPGSEMCWAAFSGDTAPALLALEASVELASPRGARAVPLGELYVNDGLVRLNKERDEILTAVRVPAASAGWRGTYRKLRIRQSIDYPLAGVAVVMQRDEEGVCRQARIGLTAVNPAPKLVPAAERLAGQRYRPELADEIARDAIRVAKPLRTSASTMEYRRHMVRVFVRRALSELWRNGH
ncbi:MAG TPA: FAD binding domain-containing protein [Terriglobia bacterium]|nr:FAD binding domain-containing protein [Terriglobia bacterium]